MKVYIVTDEPFPNGMAATSRIKCYAKALISQNINCEVLIVRKTESYNVTPKNSIKKGVIEGVPFEYLLGSPIENEHFLIRQIVARFGKLFNFCYFIKNIKKGDVVLGYLGNDFFYTKLLIYVSHLHGGYYCRDLCELPAGTGTETPEAIKKRKYILEHIFPKLDGVIAISQNLYDLAKNYVSNKCAVIKIPILVDFEQYSLDDRSEESIIPYIFHAGGLDEQQNGILGMIEAFGMATNSLHQQINFIITGNLEKSKYASQIHDLIKDYDLGEKILFTGYLNEGELKNYLSKASLVIINKYDNQQNRYCFSTKLAEYLAAAKPVIVTQTGEVINWIVDGETGYIIAPENKEALSAAIIRAFNNELERKKIGENGKILCQRAFDYRVYGKTMLEFIDAMKNNNKND